MNQTSAESTRLTRNAALLTAANVIAFVVMFAVPLVLARSLSHSEFGLYRQVFQIMTTALALLHLQFGASGVCFIARHPERRQQVIQNVLIFYFLSGATVAVTFLLCPQLVTALFQSGEIAAYVPLLGAAILTGLVASSFDTLLVATREFRTAAVLIVVSQFTKAAMLAGAAFAFRSVGAMLAASIAQSLLQLALVLCWLRHRFGRLTAPPDWSLFAAQLRNALPFGVGGCVGVVQGDLHNYFVAHYFDPAAFAIYSVGCSQLPLMGLLVGSFDSVLEPEAARYQSQGDRQSLIAMWLQGTRQMLLLVLPLCALLFVLRVEFITVLFTKSYLAAAPLYAVNLLRSVLMTSRHLNLMRVFDQFRFFRLKFYLLLLPVTWLALYAGLRVAGLQGVITAVVCVYALDVIVSSAAIGRAVGWRRRDLKLAMPLVKVAMAALIAAAAAHLLKTELADQRELVRLLVCGAVAGGVYLFCAFVLGAVTEAEKAECRLALLRCVRLVRPGFASSTGV
ncbi:MAG TPA: lipopolysaccharide biosynthesis protein [Blastocatellia bacterium]|nr:lipopolysaccharide biosynthesis protein [Blastocatellia bacterium]